MDRVKEIEAAISGLAPDEFRRFAEWFHALDQSRWDKKIDRDSAEGKLDFLFEEAESDDAKASLREWPPKK